MLKCIVSYFISNVFIAGYLYERLSESDWTFLFVPLKIQLSSVARIVSCFFFFFFSKCRGMPCLWFSKKQKYSRWICTTDKDREVLIGPKKMANCSIEYHSIYYNLFRWIHVIVIFKKIYYFPFPSLLNIGLFFQEVVCICARDWQYSLPSSNLSLTSDCNS